MNNDPFRDLHNAQLYTNNQIATLQEYHNRRRDTLNQSNTEVKKINRGGILLHAAAPSFLAIDTGDRIDPIELVQEDSKWPVLKRGRRLGERTDLDHRGFVASYEDQFDDRVAQTRIDRHGILEAISTTLFTEQGNENQEHTVLSTGKLEEGVVLTLKRYIDRVRDGTQEQTFVTVSYINMDGVYIRNSRGLRGKTEIEPSLIRTPVIALGTDDLRDELTPIIRPIWNAIGRRQSDHMIEGEWELDS